MTDQLRPAAAGRPPDPAKRAAILAAAQELFASHGFSATSMDAVARAAGVSKLTAYRHFGSKDQLFADAVVARCTAMLGQFDVDRAVPDCARTALIGFGHAFLQLILHDEALAVHRLVVTERKRAPQLGRIFHDSAIVPTQRSLARLIASLGLQVDDPALAATDLLALWRGKPMLAVEMGLDRWDHAAVAAHIIRTVDLCMGGWRTL
ncbi:MAG: TetR/AcrR family transcriptional regulator [Sphingopyxis sp.]|nr:TetR/AcrR family transcriptional regulator [Sphingopyxis sp.]